MIFTRQLFLAIAAVVVIGLGAHAAQAEAGHPYGYRGAHGSTYVPAPPYFSIHPPVYYSYPVARPYGYSPYAYPGTVKTPERKPVEGIAIINPFFNENEETKAAEKKPAKTASRRVIDNPFFVVSTTLK